MKKRKNRNLGSKITTVIVFIQCSSTKIKGKTKTNKYAKQ